MIVTWWMRSPPSSSVWTPSVTVLKRPEFPKTGSCAMRPMMETWFKDGKPMPDIGYQGEEGKRETNQSPMSGDSFR